MMGGGGSGGGGGSNRVDADRWLATSEKLLVAGDLHGAKTFAIRVCETDPHLAEPAELILSVADTLLAGESRIGGTNMPDWYGVLRLVRFTHNPELVATQYSRLAMLLNPNRNRFPYADQAFRLVSDAWFVLSDPSRKALYDRELQLSQFGQLGQLGFQLFNQPAQHQHEQQQTHTQTQTMSFQSQQLPFQLHSQPPPPQPQFQHPPPPPPQQQQQRLHFDQQLLQSQSQVQQQQHQRSYYDQQLLQSQSQPQPQPQRLQPPQQYQQVRQEQTESIRSCSSGSSGGRNGKQSVEEDRLLNLNNATERVQPTRFSDSDPFGRSAEVAEQTRSTEALWPPRPSRSVEPMRPAESIRPSEPMRLSELPRPSEPIRPVEPMRPSVPTRPSEPNRPSEPMRPSKSAQSFEPLWPPKPSRPSEPVQVSEPVQPVESIRPSEPRWPSEPRQLSKPTWTSEPMRLSEPVQPSKPMKASEPVCPSEASRSSEPTRPSEAMRPSEPFRPSEPVRASEPDKVSESTQPSKPPPVSQPTRPSPPPLVYQPTSPSPPPPVSCPTRVSQPHLAPQPTPPSEQTRPSRVARSTTAPEPKVPSFWTTCPYCFVLYEYPDFYEESVLRCQTKSCRRAFQAVKVPSPPPLTEDDRYYCCWGFFPIGFSNKIEISDGVLPNTVPRKSSPKVYYDDDDLYIEISDPSDEDEDDHDWRWNEKKKKKAKEGKPKESSAEHTKQKPGRPRKVIQNPSSSEANFVGSSDGFAGPISTDGVPKRRPGRPRKQVQNPLSNQASGDGRGGGSIGQNVMMAGPSSGGEIPMGSGRRKKMRAGAKDVGKLDLNVEFSNEKETSGRSEGTASGNGVESNTEGIGFFEELDEFFSSLPILSSMADDKVNAAD